MSKFKKGDRVISNNNCIDLKNRRLSGTVEGFSDLTRVSVKLDTGRRFVLHERKWDLITEPFTVNNWSID